MRNVLRAAALASVLALVVAAPVQASDPDLKRTSAMTVEILYLTAQLQRWLNERIARHLAAQAAKLDH